MAKKPNNQSQYVSEAASDQSYFGGNDMDYFYITGSRNSLNGGNGNDTLGTWGAQNTLTGGNGDDRIGAFSNRATRAWAPSSPAAQAWIVMCFAKTVMY